MSERECGVGGRGKERERRIARERMWTEVEELVSVVVKHLIVIELHASVKQLICGRRTIAYDVTIRGKKRNDCPSQDILLRF